jgi:hypothetical protein
MIGKQDVLHVRRIRLLIGTRHSNSTRKSSMKSIILGMCFIVTQVLSDGLGQQVKSAPGTVARETRPSLQLTISPDHFTVTPGSNFDLSITLVNQSLHDIWCEYNFRSSGIDEGYVYDIRASDGKPVRRIPGKEKERSSPYPSSPCALAPGHSLEISVGHLVRAFDMKGPGLYTIRVSRPDPDHPGKMLGTSNAVTVTVKAPESAEESLRRIWLLRRFLRGDQRQDSRMCYRQSGSNPRKWRYVRLGDHRPETPNYASH